MERQLLLVLSAFVAAHPVADFVITGDSIAIRMTTGTTNLQQRADSLKLELAVEGYTAEVKVLVRYIMVEIIR